MFAIGNDEIDAAKPLGDFILCKQCGERHRVQYGERVLANGTRVPSKSTNSDRGILLLLAIK